MRSSIVFPSLSMLALALSGCGGGDSDSSSAMVSFSVADAPVDDVKAVWVTLESVTLTDTSDDTNSHTLVINNSDGDPEPLLINLKDYQDGAKKLIISDAEVALGDYNLTLNTYGCPQSANGTGSTNDCWVVENDDTIYPLKTPSNKLKLGSFSVSQEGTQAYTIDFNLRSALVNNGGGDNYNLKPHGITIVDNFTLGKISATVTDTLFNLADDTCTAGTGNALYLYQGWHSTSGILDVTLGDEFDPDVDTDIAEDVLMPYASKLVTTASESTPEGDVPVEYVFANLPEGNYTLAFSCSDAGYAQNGDPSNGDSAEYYDQITIANPTEQWVELSVSYDQTAAHAFDVSAL